MSPLSVVRSVRPSHGGTRIDPVSERTPFVVESDKSLGSVGNLLNVHKRKKKKFPLSEFSSLLEIFGGCVSYTSGGTNHHSIFGRTSVPPPPPPTP